MGIASQITSAFRRAIELIFATIIAGLWVHICTTLAMLVPKQTADLFTLWHLLELVSISIFFTMVFMPPPKYSFYEFPLDFALFAC
jgi:hypothetical protein